MLPNLKRLEADSSWSAAGFIEHFRKDVNVIHLVRNPLQVINSYVKCHNPSKNHPGSVFRKTLCPRVGDRESSVRWATVFWIEWNKLIKERADFTQRIEDPLFALADFLMLPFDQCREFHHSRLNQHRPDGERISLDDIPEDLRDEFTSEAGCYGYGVL